MPLRADAFADEFPAEPPARPPRRRGGIRISLRPGVAPQTRWGKIAAAALALLLLGTLAAGAYEVRGFLLHDEHFDLPQDAVEIEQDDATSNPRARAELLRVFAGDLSRNIFTVPLDERRMQLQAIPWVAHATVMRLLPNRLRIAVESRTPVAFVRAGRSIGLVDASGMLFDLPATGPDEAAGRYSFPVLTGISADDPLSTRAARMALYRQFLSALDAGGGDVAHRVSEVNVSDPEDVQAIIPDEKSVGPNVLLHFGDHDFLERYQRYQQHVAEWRAPYPRLAGVDLRYDNQVVLQMQPGTEAHDKPAAESLPAPTAGSRPRSAAHTSAPAAHLSAPAGGAARGTR